MYNVHIEVRSCSHYCGGKARSVSYSEYVFAPLVSLHAMRMHHIVICGLPHSTLFFHIIETTAGFSGGEIYIYITKCGCDFIFCLKRFST